MVLRLRKKRKNHAIISSICRIVLVVILYNHNLQYVSHNTKDKDKTWERIPPLGIPSNGDYNNMNDDDKNNDDNNDNNNDDNNDDNNNNNNKDKNIIKIVPIIIIIIVNIIK